MDWQQVSELDTVELRASSAAADRTGGCADRTSAGCSTAAGTSDAELTAAGELVADRYRILRKLGEGGMAAVFLAEDTQRGTEIALKVPHLVAEGDPTVVKRFRREARAATSIKHPHVCRVYDVDEHQGRVFLTMVYIEGGSLDDWMQQSGDLTTDRAVALVGKIARGIQAAHDIGVVHRDLKTSNILMTADDEPMITDFGMVHWADIQETVLTPTGAMIGTPGYMAPEQIMGEREKIGPATDVYSLGIILYELLTGWLPFSGNLATLLGSVVSDPPPPPTSHEADIPPGLEAICLRALEKEPENRFATAAEFAEALENYNQVPPVLAAESSARHAAHHAAANQPRLWTRFWGRLVGAGKDHRPGGA